MSEVLNRTPFAAGVYPAMDAAGTVFSVVVVRAAFEVPADGPPRPAAAPPPVVEVDVPRGDPATSSVRIGSDLAWDKPKVDVVADAVAHAPGGRPAGRVLVSLRVGGMRKELVVSGDRFWKEGLLGSSLSDPVPFLTLPIVYERAFGGTDSARPGVPGRRVDARNPVGVGFHGGLSHDPAVLTQVPNVEYAGRPMTSRRELPEPAGFGVLGRSFEARRRFAGSFDDRWKAEHWPLLPPDFDPRHFQAAPPDQQLDDLKGGEEVELVNLTTDGVWKFRLPFLDIPLRLLYADRGEEAVLRTDTVFLEPELRRVTLVARAKALVPRNRGPLLAAVLGHVRPGWWQAVVGGRAYADRAGRKGLLENVPCYRT
jgi:hypothetical protein